MVALSTTKAEFIVVSKAVKEAIWLKGFIEELSFHQQIVNILCDNPSAIHLIKNHQYHEKTKHIDVKLHFIRDIIKRGIVSITKVRTEENVAYMLTKVVTRAKLEHCLQLLKLTNLPI